MCVSMQVAKDVIATRTAQVVSTSGVVRRKDALAPHTFHHGRIKAKLTKLQELVKQVLSLFVLLRLATLAVFLVCVEDLLHDPVRPQKDFTTGHGTDGRHNSLPDLQGDGLEHAGMTESVTTSLHRDSIVVHAAAAASSSSCFQINVNASVRSMGGVVLGEKLFQANGTVAGHDGGFFHARAISMSRRASVE